MDLRFKHEGLGVIVLYFKFSFLSFDWVAKKVETF